MTNDLNHWFGGDLSVSSAGDLAMSDTTTSTQQRIMRRVLTNPATQDAPADYIWNPDYGCGAPRYVGETNAKLNELRGKIVSQLRLESGVANSPAPVVTLSTEPETLYITVNYSDAATGTPQVLSFTTGGAQ